MITIEQAYSRYDVVTLIRMKYIKYMIEEGTACAPWSDIIPSETMSNIMWDVTHLPQRKRTFMRSLNS